MKSHSDYVYEACKVLDKWSGKELSAGPTQLQTLNLALIMAIADLIEVISKKDSK